MVAQLKQALRKQMLLKRGALSKAEVMGMSSAIADRLFACPRFSEAKSAAFYIPKGNEVDTSGMIARALREGKEVVVPVTDHHLGFCRFSSFEDLAPGKYGILEPKTRNPPAKEPDVVIVPGVSFGLCMHRLGYGKGYYDRYLSASPAYRIGICFDFQLVEKMPTHENDERMDEIITERRVITL